MLRTALKRIIGVAALTPGVRRKTRRALRNRFNVVYLHYVGKETSYYADFYCGSTLERLDRDLELLARHFEFCSLEELVRTAAEAAPTDALRLAVTFDDGFDLLSNGAVDVLENHGVRATSFVVTSTLDNVELMWRNKLSAIRNLTDESVLVSKYNELMAKSGLPPVRHSRSVMGASEAWPMPRKDELANELWIRCGMPPLHEFLERESPYFSWAGLENWVARGHGVGLHTATHPFCSRLSPDALFAEIVEPGLLLRSELELEFLPLSYPFGARPDDADELALYEEGAFECAFGIEGFSPRSNRPFRLERACIEGELAYSVFGKAFLGIP